MARANARDLLHQRGITSEEVWAGVELLRSGWGSEVLGEEMRRGSKVKRRCLTDGC